MLKDAGSWGLIVVNDDPEGIILIWLVKEYIYINSFFYKIELKGMQSMAHAFAQTGLGSTAGRQANSPLSLPPVSCQEIFQYPIHIAFSVCTLLHKNMCI
jgi:hypothetical protein